MSMSHSDSMLIFAQCVTAIGRGKLDDVIDAYEYSFQKFKWLLKSQLIDFTFEMLTNSNAFTANFPLCDNNIAL